MAPVTIFVDDLTLPDAARLVLERQLQRHLKFNYQLSFLSKFAGTAAWSQLEAPGALALTFLLQRMVDAPTSFIWLNGNMIVTADLMEPFTAASPVLRLQPGLRLALQSILLVNPQGGGMQALRTQVQDLLVGSFHDATDVVLAGESLPSAWQPGAWQDGRRGSLVDVRSFPARPWLNADAASARLWERDLAAVLPDHPGLMAGEIAQGRVRSSLSYQRKYDLLGRAAPPVEVQVIDAVLPHAEIAVPAWRQQTLQTIRYAPPRLLSSPARPREIPAKDWVRPGVAFPRRKQRQENKQIVLGMLLRGDLTERRKAVLLILRYIWLRRPRTVGQFAKTPIRVVYLARRVVRKLARAGKPAKARRRG